MRGLSGALACLLGLGAIGTSRQGLPAAAGLPSFNHVFVLVMENRDYGQLVGDTTNSPYLNSLVARYGLATNYYAVGRPSLPNYLALIGGSTFGITNDCTTCTIGAPNLAADRLGPAGRTWRSYQESMPSPCFVGDAYPYMQKHNPFIYFDNIRTSPASCANSVPYTRLGADLASTATTPDLAFITPNMCNDTHDCPVLTGDTWLSRNVPQILGSPAFTTQNSVLFLTWDEGNEGSVNHVPTLVISPRVPTGFRSNVGYTHYSLLRTIEASWNLAPLTPLDGGAPVMGDFFGAAGPTPAPAPTPPASPSPKPPPPTPPPAPTAGPSPAPSPAPGRPVVTGVSPISGSASGGDVVTIGGTGFTADSVVRFGSAVAAVTSGGQPLARSTARSGGAATPPEPPLRTASTTSLAAVAPAGSGTVHVTVQTPRGTSAATPADEYTYTFSNASYAIGLSASSLSPGPGASVTLVATASRDVGPTPYGMSILDATTGQELHHVASGSSDTFTVGFATGRHRYVACICNPAGANAQALSIPVVVTWPGANATGAPASTPPPAPPAATGYSITLEAGATAAAVGTGVTLTATANVDVGPTPYGISIFDTTNGAEIAHAGTGSTLAFADRRTTVGTHTYVAMVCNPNGANAQASSGSVSVTWS